MHANIVSRLRGYAHMPSVVVFVLEDQNGRDCHEVKQAMENRASQAGLGTRTHPRGGEWRVINRVVVPCLEAWYFGDWGAVCQAYPRVPSGIPHTAPYRNPDAIREPDRRLLGILQKAGYLPKDLKDLPKVEIARMVGPYMEPSRNTSRSFRVFYDALQSLLEEHCSPIARPRNGHNW